MNRFQNQKKKYPVLRNTILPICIFLLLFLAFLFGVNSISAQSEQEQQNALKTSIMQSAVHCYATEGKYPESLSYLEEHYGITYDHSKYIIDYEILGSNLMPEITVIPLNNRKEKFQ